MTLGERIKAAREKIGMTQVELGKKVGVSGVAIMRYEKGSREPRIEQLQRIANALGTIPAYLMGWKDDSGAQDIGLTAIDVAKWLDADPEMVYAVVKEKRLYDAANPEILSKISDEIERRKNKILAHEESALIKAFSKLNKEGKQKAFESIEIIAGNPKYQRAFPDQDSKDAAPLSDDPKAPPEDK